MVSTSVVPQSLDGTAEVEDARERRILNRVTWRLVPFMFLGYVIAYLDRMNIGFAKLSMQADEPWLTTIVFGHGASLFFVGYALFEIPSNLMLERVGARVWIARIMIVWGLVSMAFVFVEGVWSFYSLRILLGIAEAGFFPGMVLYLTYWFPAHQRARTGALFMTAIPVAMMVGSAMSQPLLALDEGTLGLGLKGWQWLFLVEGLPAVLLGVGALYWLTDRPEDARWLPDADRAWLSERMNRERAARASRSHAHGLNALANPKVLLLCFFYFLNNAATYGVFFFLPAILAKASGYTGTRLTLISMLPFAVALVGMVLIGRHSDRTGERRWHVAVCALTAAVGLLLLAAFQGPLWLVLLAVTLSQVGQRSILGVFWAIPPMFLGGAAAAAGIASINAVGNLGGSFGSSMMGQLYRPGAEYTLGLCVLACCLVAESVLVVSLRLPERDASQ